MFILLATPCPLSISGKFGSMLFASGECSFEMLKPYLDQLSVMSEYKLCPGISNYPSSEVRFKTKNLPSYFNRMDAQKSLLWHIPNNTKHPHGDPLQDVCTPCRRLIHDIWQLAQKSEGVNRLSRIRTDSNYPLKHLSPESRAWRVSRMTRERKNLAAKLARCNQSSFEVNDKQHHKLFETVRAIHRKDSQAIEQLCSRGDAFGKENNCVTGSMGRRCAGKTTL